MPRSLRLVVLVRALLIVVALVTIPAARAIAAAGLDAMFEDERVLTNPTGMLGSVRLLGADHMRLAVRWQWFAPRPTSRQRPRNFNAANPAAYPAGTWSSLDAVVEDATNDGISLNFDVMGGAPLWATGPGAPRDKLYPQWEPNATDYGAFVHALGTRYSGDYDPVKHKISPGDPRDLPRVSFWSVWNEPDYGPSLAPQGVPGHLKTDYAPRMYRNLVDAAWAALQATGHGSDTFLFGEVAPRGKNYWGVFSGMKPLVFLRSMYCVDSHYRELRGGAASIRGCPTTAAGSRRFRAANPALFEATGFSDHAYMDYYPPNQELHPDPDYSSLAELGNLERALDRLQGVYGSSVRFPIYNTEYGYITSPPKHETPQKPYISTAMAALYLNWSEYISWRDPRVQSFAQYLLADPVPAHKSNDWGGFASGLLTVSQKPKPTYAAWRMPLYLPVTMARRGQRLEVWGCVRPVGFAFLDTSLPQTAEIQFQSGSRGPFTTVQYMNFTDPTDCYFDARLSFPTSGTVRLAWTYPKLDPLLPQQTLGTEIYSRSVKVTVR
jgi:hypothetical protein